MTTIHRIWPLPAAELDDAGLRAAYSPDRTHPSLRMNFVTSLDGAVSVDGYSKGLSSSADRAVFHVLRAQADAIMVASGTLRHENYQAVRLPEAEQARRLEVGLPDNPSLVVVSGMLGLDADAAVFVDAPVRPIVLTRAASDRGRRDALARVTDVVVCGADEVDLAGGMAELRRRGLAHVLCEGGPHLFGSLAAAGLVDELCLTVAPIVAGPGASRIIAGPAAAAASMTLVHALAAEGDLLTLYRRQ